MGLRAHESVRCGGCPLFVITLGRVGDDVGARRSADDTAGAPAAPLPQAVRLVLSPPAAQSGRPLGGRAPSCRPGRRASAPDRRRRRRGRAVRGGRLDDRLGRRSARADRQLRTGRRSPRDAHRGGQPEATRDVAALALLLAGNVARDQAAELLRPPRRVPVAAASAPLTPQLPDSAVASTTITHTSVAPDAEPGPLLKRLRIRQVAWSATRSLFNVALRASDRLTYAQLGLSAHREARPLDDWTGTVRRRAYPAPPARLRHRHRRDLSERRGRAPDADDRRDTRTTGSSPGPAARWCFRRASASSCSPASATR